MKIWCYQVDISDNYEFTLLPSFNQGIKKHYGFDEFKPSKELAIERYNR